MGAEAKRSSMDFTELAHRALTIRQHYTLLEQERYVCLSQD